MRQRREAISSSDDDEDDNGYSSSSSQSSNGDDDDDNNVSNPDKSEDDKVKDDTKSTSIRELRGKDAELEYAKKRVLEKRRSRIVEVAARVKDLPDEQEEAT